jgi:hypothetical protein
VTASATELTQARVDARRQAKARKGIGSTILAGAGQRGGTDRGQTLAGGANTLLGGG